MCLFARYKRYLRLPIALGQHSATAGEQHQAAVVYPSVDQAGLHSVGDRLLELLRNEGHIFVELRALRINPTIGGPPS
jgi:hypothetical protein